MGSIIDLRKKLDDELFILKEEEKDIDTDDEWAEIDEFDNEQEEEQEEASKENKARIRLETESKITGIIKNLDFEVNFRDMADRINDEIDGVVLTREKAHQLFSIVRDLMGY